MRAAEAVPDIVRDLTHADFMRCAAEIKEAVVYAAAAAQQHIAGDARVESARDQRQHIFLRADREAAQPLIAPGDQQQAIVLDFEMHGNVRLVELHLRAGDMLIQAAADVALYVLRAKLMFTAALNAHAEAFVLQAVAIERQRLLKNIVHVGIGTVFDRQHMVNAGNAGELIHNHAAQPFVFRTDFDVIPVTHHGDILTDGFQHVANIAGEDFNKAQSHRLTFDGDFGK